MSELSLESVMNEPFRAIADTENSKEAYRQYRSQLKELDTLGRLSVGHVRELIYEHSEAQADISEAITEILGSPALIAGKPVNVTGRTFEPGASAVVIRGSGRIDAVHHDPNPDATLTSYGNGLMWALFKVGDEKLANSYGHRTSTNRVGYEAVSNSLNDKPIEDIPFKDRHHLGGATISLHRWGAGVPREDLIVHGGTSGVLLTPTALSAIRLKDESLNIIARHAHYEKADDGFEGNIFAGAIDSLIGELVLRKLYFNMPDNCIDLCSIAQDFSLGINVH